MTKKATFDQENLAKNKEYLSQRTFKKIIEPKTPKAKVFSFEDYEKLEEEEEKSK